MQETSAEFVAHPFYRTDRSSPGRFIWSHIRRHPWVGLGVIVGAFSNAALASVLPYLIGEAFNAIVDSKDMQRVGFLSLVIVVSQVIRGGLQLMRNFSSETFAQRVERDVRDELYASLLGKSMAYHDLQPVGEIMARVANDVREMNFFMSPGLNMVVGSGMFLLMPLVASPMIHPALILTPALFIPIYAFVQYRYVRSLHRVAQDVRARFGRMNARLAETLDGIEVVKGTAQEEEESARLSKLIDDVRDRFIDQGRIEARYFAILLFGIAVVGAFLHAAILYRANAIDIGDAISFMGQISLFDFPVFTSSFSLARLASGFASAERILNVITAKTDLDQNEAGLRPEMKGSLTFDQVDFSFMPGSLVLRDISFSIEPGQTVAIVGQTGSGKSALTRLINRTYDVDTGRVLVDGIDVRDWYLAALRSQISIIEQEIFLFSRTIADNIRFGCPGADQQAVEEAAKKAQAHDFIMSFPEGYETVIGQRGVTLSGGQRQRLAIARAFLTDPRILILDDSTSAIDSATEDQIQKAIWAAAHGRTTILITHRLSQIRWADHIIVMRKGRIVAQGRHEDLIQQSNAYRRIFARYEGVDEPPADSANTPSGGEPPVPGEAV